MLAAVISMVALALVCALLLTISARQLRADNDEVVDRIDELLPQTQCAQCGYPGCRPYAKAIAYEGELINRCPPGGDTTIIALAQLLNRDVIKLDESLPPNAPPSVAVIDESACIGCARCLPACPVDAIIGAHQFSHTIVSDICTGCELCIAPCPVDCITMVNIDGSQAA